MHLILRAAELSLHTRRQNQVKNQIDWQPMHYGALLQVIDYKKQYARATHRTAEPTRKYNCHGLTFASRRTWIDEAPEIRKILAEDDYEQVSPQDVLPGDVVVYYVDGDVEHSGVIVSKGDIDGPWVLSKWGWCQEVVHRIPECPYKIQQVVFYRINR